MANDLTSRACINETPIKNPKTTLGGFPMGEDGEVWGEQQARGASLPSGCSHGAFYNEPVTW